MEYFIVKPINWICPHCQHATTITPERVLIGSEYMLIPNKEGGRLLQYRFIVCPNPDCQRITLDIRLREGHKSSQGTSPGEILMDWRLLPPSDAKQFNAKIPNQIIADYVEACIIKYLSPKASATLSRRCLQGMIRDFWGISKHRLKDEVDALQEHVDTNTWEAIDAVRKVGNIGAHMEADVNMIIDVEPREAQKLISLIELLLQEWYVEREDRQRRVKEVIDVSRQKDSERDDNSEK